MITKLGIIIQAIVIVLVIGAVVVMVPMLAAIFAIAVTIAVTIFLLVDHKITAEEIREEEELSKSEQKPQKD